MFKAVFHRFTPIVIRWLRLLSLVILPLPSAMACRPTHDTADQDVCIVFENDLHGHLEAYARIAFIRDSVRADGVVSSGDFLQGGIPTGGRQTDEIARMVSDMGYLAITPGNHEFDNGPTELFDLYHQHRLPLLACNLETTSHPEDEGAWQPMFPSYRVVEIKGHRVGFVGIATPSTLSTSKTRRFKNEQGRFLYRFHEDDLADVVQMAVNKTRNEGADIVVVLSHLGSESTSNPISSDALVRATHGIDIVLDGHSHDLVPCDTLRNKWGQSVLRAQTGSFGTHTGVLRISPDGNCRLEVLPFCQNSGTDPALNRRLRRLKAQAGRLNDRTLGYSPVDLNVHNGKDAWLHRNAEAGLGDFYADALRETTGADLALINSGGLRDNLSAGPITHGDIVSSLPFGSGVCVVDISGRTLADLLEYSVHQLPESFGGFCQVSGVTFNVNPAIPTPVVRDRFNLFSHIEEGASRRVSCLRVQRAGRDDWETINPEAIYRLACTSYLALDQGDGNTLLAGYPIEETQLTEVETVERYLLDIGGKIPVRYGQSAGRMIIQP